MERALAKAKASSPKVSGKPPAEDAELSKQLGAWIILVMVRQHPFQNFLLVRWVGGNCWDQMGGNNSLTSFPSNKPAEST